MWRSLRRASAGDAAGTRRMSPGGWHSQGGIGYVGSADQGAAEAGQGPSRAGRAATGRRAARLGPGAGDVHVGPDGPGPGLHSGRVRKRGESACARAGPAPPGRTASHAGDDGRHTRRPARVHRPDRRRRVDGLDEPGRLTVTAAASTDWTEAVVKPEETPGQRVLQQWNSVSRPSGSGAPVLRRTTSIDGVGTTGPPPGPVAAPRRLRYPLPHSTPALDRHPERT